MLCSCSNNNLVDVIGQCDPSKIIFTSSAVDVNFTEISIPEICNIPCEKPDVESVEKVFVSVKILSKRVVKTPERTGSVVTNAENTILTGRKLIVEGILCQKIVYTADVLTQTVHSAHFNVPFSAFIIVPETIDISGTATDTLDIPFCIDICVEDVFVKAFNARQIFKNVTLFLRAKPDIKECVVTSGE